jgi:glucose-fructose oxidoreductase
MMQAKTPDGKVRYAVVGLGHIAQVAVLPAFKHAANAELTALVSGDAVKQRKLGRKYGVREVYDYARYEECLDNVDAVFIALPNSEHAEFTIRAANAGVHVLCEKPLASTVEDAERMVTACREAGVKLMTAYRLHFEPTMLEIIDQVRGGTIGEPKFFTSSFGMRVKEDDIRAQRELGGGSVFDLGVYCINAARYLFRAEPKEVLGCVTNSVPNRLPEVDESTAAILRFDGERLATFVSSFNASDVSSFSLVGTKGELRAEPAYEYAEALAYTVTVAGKKTKYKGKKHDQFAGEIVYFSDCVLADRTPEPSGEEGLQDVRIVTAIYESAETGKFVQIPPYEQAKRPGSAQAIDLPPVGKVETVKADAPHY